MNKFKLSIMCVCVGLFSASVASAEIDVTKIPDCANVYTSAKVLTVVEKCRADVADAAIGKVNAQKLCSDSEIHFAAKHIALEDCVNDAADFDANCSLYSDC